MKTLVEGNELLQSVPENCNCTGRGPVVRLENGLVLDDGNCFQSPTLLLGSVGSGKTTLMNSIMDPVLAHAEQSGDNVVIFCAKPNMLRFAREEDIVISITTEDEKACWNLFREIEASEYPDLALREITLSLFAEARERTTQVFFPDAASDTLYCVARYLRDLGKRKNITLTNSAVVKFFDETSIYQTGDGNSWWDYIEAYPEYFSRVRDYIGDGTGEQGSGVLSEIRLQIIRTLYGSFASEKGTFSARESLRGGNKRIFLYYDYCNSGRSTLSVMKVLLELLMKQAMGDRAHKTWFFLDEGSLLPKAEIFETLSYGRDPFENKTGGVRVLMALQSARLMTRHYTQLEAETLLSLFPNVIALQVSDPFSRAIVAERYGKARYRYTFRRLDGKTMYQDSVENVVSDYAFSHLDKAGKAIISMPGVCKNPFFYDGYTERKE